MWLLLSLSVCYLLSSCSGSTTSLPTSCYDYVCYDSGCLRTDISNQVTGIAVCTPTAGQSCAIKVWSNATIYEVTATCEDNCQPTGNKASAMITYCCYTISCNNDEAKIPDANTASLLSMKWTLIVVQILLVFFLPCFFSYN